MGEQCNLTGDVAALLVQLGLGLVLVLTLIIKWQCYEKPRRVFKVWIFDAMKQAFAAGVQHMCNLLIATVIFYRGTTLAETDHDETCGWYMVTQTVDAALGTFIAWVLLRKVIEPMAIHFQWTPLMTSGDYGQHETPPNIKCNWWFMQLLAWLFATIVGRAVCLGVLVATRPLLKKFVHGLTELFGEEHTMAYLLTSMLFWPMIVNVAQVIVQDEFFRDNVGGSGYNSSSDDESKPLGGGDSASVNYVSIGDGSNEDKALAKVDGEDGAGADNSDAATGDDS